MVVFNPIFQVSLGSDGDSSIYVKDNNGDWQEFITYEYFEVLKRQNQKSEFEIKIFDIQDEEKKYVKEFYDVMFFAGKSLILKGRIQKVKYDTGYSAKITGFGSEAKLSDRELDQENNTSATWQTSKRGQWTNISAQTIAKEILSENTDGSSPYILSPSSEGIFDTDYGNLSIRFEHANRLKALSNLSKSIDYEWWVDWDDQFNDYFNIGELQPSKSRATNVQETFKISGNNANATRTEKETDVESMANKIDGLGRGDGINQIETSAYNAADTFTTLRDDISDNDTTIPLKDATDFPSSGTIRIMEEQVTYTGKSGNDLTGATRGANSTTALKHKSGVFVEEHFTISNAESGSSIGTNGLLDFTVTNRDIIDLPTLELAVSRELLRRKDPIVRIKFEPNEPTEFSTDRKVGDLININDPEADISSNYRIVSIKYTSDYGLLKAEVEASNKSLNYLEQMQERDEEQENMEKYMQGATNIDTTSVVDNLANESSPSSNPAPGALDLYFFIPEDAVAINQVKLSYRLQAPKTWGSSTEEESTHTHGIPQLTVNGTTTQSDSHSHDIDLNTASSQTFGIGIEGSDLVTTPFGGNNISTTESEGHSHTVNGSTTQSDTSDAGSSHSHGVAYDLATQSYTASDVRIFTSNDASSTPSWNEQTSTLENSNNLNRALNSTENSTESNVNMSQFFSGTGWKGIRIVTDGDARAYASVTNKVFIESTKE